MLEHGADEATSLLSREEALLARTRTRHVVGTVVLQAVDGHWTGPKNRIAKTPYTESVGGNSTETGILALANMGQDRLALQVASMNYDDIFVRYTRALDQRAQARSEKEIRSMTNASQVSARAMVASVIVAVAALLVALLSHVR